MTSAHAEPPLEECAAASDGEVGWVHSWDLSTGVDGPGTRIVVFLSGCPLRCVYCQNPDTWRRGAGDETSLNDLQDRLRRYHRFIAAAGGGFTVSGGEPLQQPAFCRRLLELAQDQGYHTALDTSGFLGRRADDALLDATDLVLLDIKAGSDATHRRVTGRPVGPTLEFAERLAGRGQNVWVRFVLVPGLNDDPGEVEWLAHYIKALGNIERVDVLPFHKLGESKYDELGIPFPLSEHPSATPEQITATRRIFEKRGLLVT